MEIFFTILLFINSVLSLLVAFIAFILLKRAKNNKIYLNLIFGK
jgi:hypothetical protein